MSETEQSIAADAYWMIAETMDTESGLSVLDHVTVMKELLQDALEYLSDIPESNAGGDDDVVALCKKIRVCLNGRY